jgi:HEAT repeat protein
MGIAVTKGNYSKCDGSGKIDNSQKISKLTKKLDSEITSVRKSALNELASIGEPGILAMIDVLEDDVNFMHMHPEVIKTLSAIGEPAVKLIIESLDSESDANIQWKLLEALNAIGEPAINPLLQMLESKNAVERSNAARTFGLMSDKRALEPLINLLASDTDCEPRGNVAKALGKIGDDKATDALIESLNDTEAFVRRESAKALGKLKNKKAVEPLIMLLKDPVYKVRADAATALKEIGDDRAVAPMIEVLDSRGGGWYWSADHFIKAAILKFKSRRTVELLIEAFRSDNIDIKQPAAETVAKMGNIALKPLVQALGDEDIEVRYYAAKSLGLKGDKRAIKALMKIMDNEDEDVDVRGVSQNALMEIAPNY